MYSNPYNLITLSTIIVFQSTVSVGITRIRVSSVYINTAIILHYYYNTAAILKKKKKNIIKLLFCNACVRTTAVRLSVGGWL